MSRTLSPYVSQVGPGRLVDIDDPRPTDVAIEDIARALGRICRFNGHIKDSQTHYSVAQHSVIVSRLCRPENALIGLLHDAAEAYIGDIVTPVKRLVPGFEELEIRWAMAIGQRFGIGTALVALPRDVQEADRQALAWEGRDVLDEGPGRQALMAAAPMPHVAQSLRLLGYEASMARGFFLDRFEELARRFGIIVDTAAAVAAAAGKAVTA